MVSSQSVTGVGLITGALFTAWLEPLPPGSGIVFNAAGQDIPAVLASVLDATRGVTLGSSRALVGRPADESLERGEAPVTLSIIEHFLAACALCGATDLRLSLTTDNQALISAGRYELPLLDGSARDWLPLLAELGYKAPPVPIRALPEPLFYWHRGLPDTVSSRFSEQSIVLYALPSDQFRVSYALDYDHPAIGNQWVTVTPGQEDGWPLASARTFGWLSELPAMQARGLAMGVSIDNTLGLADDGGLSSPLRFNREPIYHKILDLLGDLMLTGVNPLSLKAHIVAQFAGHASHIAFARLLKPYLA